MRQTVVWTQRRRTSPHFVIEKVRHGLYLRILIGAHRVIAAHLDVANFPKQSRVNNLLLCGNAMRRTPALRTYLHHALETARRVEHRLAFNHAQADWLLTINIRARFHCRNRVQCVPMIRRPDNNDVQFLLLKHDAIVRVSFR